jgi:hypothetical protein
MYLPFLLFADDGRMTSINQQEVDWAADPNAFIAEEEVENTWTPRSSGIDLTSVSRDDFQAVVPSPSTAGFIGSTSRRSVRCNRSYNPSSSLKHDIS